MARLLALLATALVCVSPAFSLQVHAPGYTATLDNSGLSSLADKDGTRFVSPSTDGGVICIHRVARTHSAGESSGPQTLEAGADAQLETTAFADLPNAKVNTACRVDQATGDLVLQQSVISPQPGVWGVSFRVANIPLDMNILVPGNSGMKLTTASPVASMTFE